MTRYEENKQYREAIEVLERLLPRGFGYETEKKVFVWLAELYLSLGDRERALDNWRCALALEQSPAGDATLHELHGRILLAKHIASPVLDKESNLLDQAIEIFQQALVLEPEAELLAQLYVDLGSAYRERRLPDVAAGYLEKVLAQPPQDKQLLAECYLKLGLIELWDHNQPTNAIQLLETALDMSPEHPPSNWLSFVYQAIAWAWQMAEDAKEAIKAGKNALQAVEPREHDYEHALFQAHYTLGAAYEQMEREDQAIEHYRAALVVKDHPYTYECLGNLYLKKQDPQQALRMYESVLESDPNYSHKGDIYNNMALALHEMKRYREALACLEKAREEQASISFKPAELYSNIGITRWRLDQFDEAEEAFKTALGLMRPKDKGYRRIERYLRQVQAGVGLKE